MSLALILGCLWVLAAAGVALLPMRLQYAPGLALLLSAPALLIYIGIKHGALVALLALAGAVSMFRRPLLYLGRKALGRSGPEGRT